MKTDPVQPEKYSEGVPSAARKLPDTERPRCPMCGFPVTNFFDHVDRDNGFAENGECK